MFGQKQRAKRLVRVTDSGQGLNIIEDAMQNLAGDTAPRIVQNQYVTFDPRQVMDASEILYDSNGLLYGTWQQYPDVYNGGTVRYWILPITPGAVIPFCIQAAARKLVVGIDFFVVKDQFLLFRVDPRILFDGSSYLIVTGRQARRSLLEYPLGVHVKGRIQPVVNYCRNNQTPAALQAALVEIAGIASLPSTQKLLAINVVDATETIYTFSTDVIRVTYAHPLLTVGQTYQAGYIIGGAIQVVAGSGHSTTDWWREVDWQGGISLDPLMAFKGLRLPDQLVWAYAAGVDPNGNVHTRIPLSADFWAEKAYWDGVALKETNQGYYLNSVVGITPTANHYGDFSTMVTNYEAINTLNAEEGLPQISPNTNNLLDKRLVNPLDTFFQAILSSRALIITVDLSMVSNAQGLFNFISREVPFGAATILLCYLPSISEANYSLQLCGDSVLLSTMGVEMVPASPDQFSIGAGSGCRDWVRLQVLKY